MSRRLNDLISSVWGNVEGKPLHLRELNAMSFCAADGAKVVGYAGDLVEAKKIDGMSRVRCAVDRIAVVKKLTYSALPSLPRTYLILWM